MGCWCTTQFQSYQCTMAGRTWGSRAVSIMVARGQKREHIGRCQDKIEPPPGHIPNDLLPHTRPHLLQFIPPRNPIVLWLMNRLNHSFWKSPRDLWKCSWSHPKAWSHLLGDLLSIYIDNSGLFTTAEDQSAQGHPGSPFASMALIIIRGRRCFLSYQQDIDAKNTLPPPWVLFWGQTSSKIAVFGDCSVGEEKDKSLKIFNALYSAVTTQISYVAWSH